jgi:DNA-binding transcriptional ArsR family regulator
MQNPNLKKLDAQFDALANSKRRGMLLALAYRPATVTRLAAEFKLTLPAIHKHIRVLEASGLIQRRKVGRTNFVAINRQGLQQVQAWVAQFRSEWGNDRASLDNYITHFRDDK